jgi:phosphoribosylformylglycinamidine synthase
MPFVSGKDSLSSTYRYPDGKVLKIPPVLLISVFGKISDVRKTVSSDFKKVGSSIVLVGKTDNKNLGGSAYFDVAKGLGDIPHVDIKNLKSVFNSITLAIHKGQILSCHDISEGGLAAAISEMCIGANFGASIDIAEIDSKTRPDLILFSETTGTFLVEVESRKIARKLFSKVPHVILGETIKDKKIFVISAKKIITAPSLPQLKSAWQKPMKEIFH